MKIEPDTDEEKKRYEKLMQLLDERIRMLRKIVKEITNYTVCYEIDCESFTLAYMLFRMKYGNYHYNIKCYPVTSGIHGLDVEIAEEIIVRNWRQAYNLYKSMKKTERWVIETFREVIEPFIDKQIWEITA